VYATNMNSLAMKPIRIGICALLTFSVLAHGVVEPWSEAVLEIGAAILLALWGWLWAFDIKPTLRWNWLLSPILGLWALAVVQYLTRTSAVPFLTEIEILKLSALGIIMFLAVQSFVTLEHWHGFVWFLLTLGFLISLFGVLQYFTFNGKLYWFREVRDSSIVFGPYVSRDHFAGLIELIAPVGLSILVLRAFPRDRVPLLAVLTVLPIGALFLAASRGGIVAFSLEIAVLSGLVFVLDRSREQIFAGAAILLLAAALVAWLGPRRALERFASSRHLEVSEARRIEMMKDSWRIFVDHPVIGTGLGTLREVFPQYETLYDGLTVNHSHNDYLEALAETGLVGGICGFAFLTVLFRGAQIRLAKAKSATDLAFHIGAFTACCGLLAHSFVDFNLHLPANALLFLVQATLATSENQLSVRPAEPVNSPVADYTRETPKGGTFRPHLKEM